MRDTTKYGEYYWCVKVPKDVSKDGEIYLMADEVRLTDGAAVFSQRREEDPQEHVNLILPPGKWWSIYAASLIDGSAVAVEHWAGELISTGEIASSDDEQSPGSQTKIYRTLTKSLRHRILERDSFKCRACGKGPPDGAKLEIDHKNPESLGGETTIANLQTLCQDCNRGKGNIPPAV